MVDWAAEILNQRPAPPPAGDVDWAAEILNRQSLTSGDGRRRIGPPRDDNAAAASIRATGNASLLPDVTDQIASYSRSMGIPENRFGVVDGNIVYSDENGNLARVTPSVSGGNGFSDTAQRVAR